MNRNIWYVLLLIFYGMPSFSQHKGINFQAVLKSPSKTYPTVSGLTATVQILTPDNCVLREEQHYNINVSNGYINLVIGGANSVASGGHNPTPVLSLTDVFDNSTGRSGLTCVNGDDSVSLSNQTYTPLSSHARKMRLRINIPGEGMVVADFNMRSVPFAENSEMLDGKRKSDFIQVDNSYNVNQTSLNNFFGHANYANIGQILSGTYNAPTATSAITATTATNVSGTVGIANGGTGATTQAGAVNALLPSQVTHAGQYLTTDGTNISWSAAAGGTTGNAGGDLTGTYPNPTLTVSGVTAGTYGGTNKTINSIQIDAKGRITNITDSLISLNGNQITAGTIGSGFGGTGLSTLGTANQILGINSTADAYEFKSITAGTGISISHGPNSITINSTASGGSVTNVSSANTDIGVGTGTTTPILTLNSGIAGGAGDANKIAKLDASGLLVTGMIPNLDAAKISTGTLPIARGGTNSATALNNNRIMASSSGAIVEAAAITANKALISDVNGIPTHSSVTDTELGYLSGVTSAIQTQLNSKTSSSGWTNYSVMAVNGSGALNAIPGTVNGSILNYTATGPAWTSASFPTITTVNQLLYSSSNNVVAGLASANNAILTTSGTGVPSWSVISNDNFTQYALLAGRSGGQTINGGTAASENLTLNSTGHATKGNVLINSNGGNVGIGTTSPNSLLHVLGNGNTTANIESANGSNGNAILQLTQSGNATWSFEHNGSGNKLRIWNSSGGWGSPTMVLDPATGNVGIGTITPGAALEVAGQVKITGGTPGAGKVLTSDAAGLASWSTPSGGSAALSGITAATATNTIANANFAQTWNWDTLTTQTALSLGSASMTTGSILSLTDSFNSATSTGSVLKLTASGASNAATPLSITNAGTGYSVDVAATGTGTKNTLRLQNTVAAANSSGSGVVFATNRTTGGLTNVAGVSGIITDITNNAYKGALIFSTANNAAPAEVMRIDNAGNVGIGTTNPGSKLDVSGDINYTGALYGGRIDLGSLTWNRIAGELGINHAGGAGLYVSTIIDSHPSIRVEKTATQTSNLLEVASGSSATGGDLVTINPSGNVGIGITNPNAPLTVTKDGTLVNGTMYAVAAFDNTAYSKGIFLGYDSTGSIGIVGADSGAGTSILAFTTRNSSGTSVERMRLDGSGNVGIGTTTPGEKLEVAGNARVSGQISTGSQTIVGGTTAINWNNGNSVLTDYNCASNFTFSNLRDGGTYTLVVTDAGTTQCGFSTTTTGTDAATVTYKFNPVNTTRSASTYTVYTLMRVGTVVLVSWSSGFQ